MIDPRNDRYSLHLPHHLQALFGEASLSASRGDWTRAIAASGRLLELLPMSIPARQLAGMVMFRTGHYRRARALTLQAAVPPIDVPEMLLESVRWLRKYEEPQALESLVAGSDWRAIGEAAMLGELALHLGSCWLLEPAFEVVRHGLRLHPKDADLHYLHGLFEMFSGNAEASMDAGERALDIRPGMPNAHLLLSMQDGLRRADERIAQIRRALVDAQPGSEAEGYLCYSLHQHLDALGRHEEAWDALSRGHRARRMATSYERSTQDALFRALKASAGERPAQPETSASGRTGLIFIVGMFRSGTSLLERVLAGHPEVEDGGETYQFSACLRDATDRDHFGVIDADIAMRAASADFGAIRRRMQAYADWRSRGRARLTEKLPPNFLNVGFILRALPDARILHMRRDPTDTCFSNLRTYFSGAAPYACDQSDLADYYRRYRDLMAYWHEWAPGRILDVDYAAFVAEPEVQARRVMDHCGLSFVPEALDVGRKRGISATASAAHVRKGILTNRGSAWSPYRQYLRPLLEGLQGLD